MEPKYLLTPNKPPRFYNRRYGYIRIQIDLDLETPIHSGDFEALTELMNKRGYKILGVGQKRILTCRHCLSQEDGDIAKKIDR